MISNVMKTVGKCLAAVLLLVGSSSAWSAYENLLNPSFYVGAPFNGSGHTPRIDMTDITLNYNMGSELFMGSSKRSSTFTLYDPNSVAKTFTGYFALVASITPNGTLDEGVFGFFSNDSYFGFNNSFGNWGNVFSGKLTAVGASSSKNAIEFDTGKFSGWACAQGWCTQAERLWFTNVDGFPDSGWNKSWSDQHVNGTAVIPVPAAAWLFGSGLLGLIGISKRKKV